jgi:hypothetical protein
MKILTTARPYVLSFPSGNYLTMTSEEAQRVLGVYPVSRATDYAVTLQSSEPLTLRPATLGGGPAFIIER